MIQPANIPEIPEPDEAPSAFAERLAKEKALAISPQHPGDFVLGADTVVVVDRQILGKPADQLDAVRMLRLLSGRRHEVITGVCVVSPHSRTSDSQPAIDIASERTIVTMDDLSAEDIRAYVATREPMDKAGAYAIQGIASRWISRIEGDYSNVVGLPVSLIYRMLKRRGAIQESL